MDKLAGAWTAFRGIDCSVCFSADFKPDDLQNGIEVVIDLEIADQPKAEGKDQRQV